MLTIDYLKTILRGEMPTSVTNPKEQIMEGAGGYDGIIALIQTKNISPAIILENSDIGEFLINPGGFEKTSQSIWVMKMAPKDGNRSKIQRECKAMMKKMISIFVEHEKDEPLSQWEWDRIPYGIRNAGANFTGYEFTLYFSENTDLEYHE
ncbi:MAG: hypothetical protein IJ057_03885 [Bacteroidales bacterium]|nr:hypothetical protein [Bacteroidales bacterium]